MNVTNLYQADCGIAYQVVDSPKGLLENLGIHAGSRVEIKIRYALGGPVLLNVENAYSIAVGKDVAEKVQVVTV
ncbi:MAG: ferrous iron transport protein A [Oscillospiraceae bacterium]|nr:ferrous iron transport protein A [Oscillospiraceae bacterium]